MPPPPRASAERGFGQCDIPWQLWQASSRQLMPHSCLYQGRYCKRRKGGREREVCKLAKSFKVRVKSGEGIKSKYYCTNSSWNLLKGQSVVTRGKLGNHQSEANRYLNCRSFWKEASQWQSLHPRPWILECWALNHACLVDKDGGCLRLQVPSF